MSSKIRHRIAAFAVVAGAAILALSIASEPAQSQTTPGITRVTHDTSLVGSGTVSNPLSVDLDDCPGGSAVQAFGADGAVTCIAVGSGGGITNAGSGLFLTGGDTVELGCAAGGGLKCNADDVEIRDDCSTNALLKWSGTAWACGTDIDTDTNTTYSAGDGLNLAGTVFSFLNGCSNGQIPKKTAGVWACGTDVDTDTNTTYSAGDGISLAGTTFSLLAGCSNGQIPKKTGGVWACGSDTDTDTNTTYSASSPLQLTSTTFTLALCGANQIVKMNGGATAWACAADATGSGVTGSGTSGVVPLWSGGGTSISDSIMTQTSGAITLASAVQNTALGLTNTATGGRNWLLGSGATASTFAPNSFFIYDATSGITRFSINDSGKVTINEDTTLEADLSVDGLADFNGVADFHAAVDFDLAVTMQSTLAVTGAATFNVMKGTTATIGTGGSGTLNNASTGTATVIRLNYGTATITGFDGGVDGRILYVYNANNVAITFTHEAGTSTAANRLSLPGSTPVYLNSRSGGTFAYDGTQQRWVYLGLANYFNTLTTPGALNVAGVTNLGDATTDLVTAFGSVMYKDFQVDDSTQATVSTCGTGADVVGGRSYGRVSPGVDSTTCTLITGSYLTTKPQACVLTPTVNETLRISTQNLNQIVVTSSDGSVGPFYYHCGAPNEGLSFI